MARDRRKKILLNLNLKIMSKRLKNFSLGLIIFSFLLVLSFVLYQPEKKLETESQKSKKIIQLENEYQQQAKMILADYRQIANLSSISSSEISVLRSRLLQLTVPLKFKDLHLDLVLAFTKTEDSLAKQDQKLANESQQLINKVLVNYQWLN